MDLIHIEGEDKPKMIFTPYVWATVIGSEEFYVVKKHDGKVDIFDKKGKKVK